MPVPIDLRKLSDVLKNDVVKNTVYDKLVAKVNSIATSRLVSTTKYDADKSEIKLKFVILGVLLKRQTTMLKSLKSRLKYQVLVALLQILH